MIKKPEVTKGIITSTDIYDSKDETYNNKEINYWRGFGELYNDPEFLKEVNREFPKEVTRPIETSVMNGISRRKFLALLSASAAVAAAGCSNYRDKGEIVPYNQKPEGIIEGNPNYFASTLQISGEDLGVLVKAREGRPIKVDGNPEHPVSKGKTNLYAQATVLSLYDPDRLREPKFSTDKNNFSDITWDAVDESVLKALHSAVGSGKEIAVVSHSVISPTTKKLLDEFVLQFPTTKVYSYEIINDSLKNSAWVKCYGSGVASDIKWDEANIILALECDFLGTERESIEAIRKYASSKDLFNGSGKFNRLYCVEGDVSLTGLNSDYRLRLRTDAIEELTLALINEIGVKKGASKIQLDSQVVAKVSGYDLKSFAEKYSLDQTILGHLVNDLISNSGSSIVSAGSAMPESTHIAVNLLNEVLGNTSLYSFDKIEEEILPLSYPEDLSELAVKMKNGHIGVLLNFDSNPVYELEKAFGFEDGIKNTETVVTLTEIDNETSVISNYVLPINNPLESWGDFRTRKNYYGLQQPLIAPLYNTRQKEAVIFNWIRGGEDYNETLYHQYLKDNWQENIYPTFNSSANFNDFWFGSLHDGFVLTSSTESEIPMLNQDSIQETGNKKPTDSFVVLLRSSYTVGDGRYANNGWLQELPHPVSKIVWDNYAALSPVSAKTLGVNSGEMVEVKISGRLVKVPVFIQPSMADNVLSIELGYGRTSGGKVAEGVGFDVVPLIGDGGLSKLIYNNALVSKADGKYKLVSTQEHYPIDNPRFKDIQFKRRIIQQGTYNQFKKDPESIVDREYVEGIDLRDFPSINKDIFEYKGLKWAMAIDLNKCIGCGGCIMSCNVENNIPVVGKEQAGNKRAMQWIRLDRYYFGTPEDARANFQPMLCQHCDFAPCENVCPVLATTHSEDGLNGMAYNRCVGTRYCSNNCPYKVRRFNYFNFRHEFKDDHYDNDSMELARNPEVTVRSRGVMEKCTFCVQRIMKARQVAIQENRQVKGSDVITACQEACPSDAIKFGDMNDESSPLQQYRNSDIAYYVLEEIKVKPNVTYISKIFNIEEEVPKAGHH